MGIMQGSPDSRQIRYPKQAITSLSITIIHRRSPWVAVWWSAAFPGFGQILLGRNISGFILLVWELLMNNMSHLNTAIIYSLTGQFEMAKQVLHQHWALNYVAVYIFAMWTTYRAAVEINKRSVLADRADSPITPVSLDTRSLNFLDKRNPWLAAVWSALMPGLGQLYNHRLMDGFLILLYWITISHFSNILDATHFTLVGDFAQARAVVNPQWLLFMPSLWGFGIYSAYVQAVELNKLFETEQSRHLKKGYQGPGFVMPV